MRLSVPPNSEAISPAVHPRVTVASLYEVNVTANGSDLSPSMSFVELIKTKLRESGLFERVRDRMPQGPGLVSVSVTLEERPNLHKVAKYFKTLLVGGTIFVASPLVRFHYDIDSVVELIAVRWDGQERAYRATGSGSMSCSALAVRRCERPGTPADWAVASRLLNEVMRQMIADTSFFEVQ